MAIITENTDCDGLERVVVKAHDICNEILLFKAVDMGEDQVRVLLDRNHVSDHDEMQEAYLELIREYDAKTSGKKTSEMFGTIR
jgi:hypothetical protein